MPFKRRSYKRGKGSRRRNRSFRKANKANRFNKSGRMLTYKGPSFMPDRFFTKLKLTNTFTIGSTSVPAVETQIIGNDLFDPLGGAGALQPQGFDQFCPAIYNQFRVHGSKVVVSFIASTDTTGTGDCVVWVYPSVSQAQVSTASGPNNIVQQRCKWGIASRYANQIKKIKHYMSSKVIGGVQDISDSPEYSGSDTASPVRQWWWHIGASTIDGTIIGLTGMKCVMQVTYFAEFMGRRTIALS